MSLKPYDEAVTKYFEGIFRNTVYAPTDLAFKASAKKNGKENAKLPLISVFRTPTISVGELANVNEMAFRRGAVMRRDMDALKIHKVRMLPVKLEYQIDLWTEGLEDIAGMFAEVLFFLKDYPAFEVTLPGVQEKFSHVLEITEIVDNTDLLEEPDRGRLGRMSIICTVDAYIAKPTSSSLVDSSKVNISIEV